MVHIGPNLPTTTPKPAADTSSSKKAAISVSKQVPQPNNVPVVDRRKTQDRRQNKSDQHQFIDLRSTRDRRRHSTTGKSPSIDIKA